ncbi:MAG: PorT family protein [Saprospiraceae bacterium]|nr:PorT family protein [Saprospiraceae bacterium]
MRLLYCLLLVAATTQLYAQNHPWTFGAQLQANFSFLTYQNPTNPNYETRVRDQYYPRFAPGGIFTTGYRLTTRVSLQIGLGVWLSGARIKEQDLIITTPDLPEGMLKGTFEGKLHYLDLLVPVSIKANPISGNHRFYLIAGFSGLYNLSRKQTIIFHFLDGTNEKVQEEISEQYRSIPKLNLRSDLGFGYTFPIGQKMQWFLEPMVGYQVFPIIKEGNAKWGQYFLGINLGMTLER